MSKPPPAPQSPQSGPRPTPRPAAPRPAQPAMQSRSLYYTGGAIRWDFNSQPTFLPDLFQRIRNRSQAWHYKLTTLVMFAFLAVIAYGGVLGFQYYQISQKSSDLNSQLQESKRKELQDTKQAKELIGKMLEIEKKIAFDTVRIPASEGLFLIASNLPENFFIQNISVTEEDVPVSTKQNRSKSGTDVDVPKTLTQNLTISGRIVGIGEKSTESALLQAFKSVPEFKVTQVQTQPNGEGADITFKYSKSVTYEFENYASKYAKYLTK
jgi:hypothetical protein